MVSPARIRTNRLLAKAFDLNDFLDPTRLAHDELQYYNDLTRAFDKIISHYIDWLDSPEAKKLFYEEIKNREEYFQAIDGDLDDIIKDTSLSADRIIEKVYRKGLNYGYKDINRLPVFNDACKYGLKATQEYNFELIQSVSNDLKDSIRHHIFRGIAEGQSIHEVARAITDSGLKPIEGKTLSAYQRASLIARTEIARSMTTGRLQSYANYGVEKVKILTAGDDNVCPICRKAEKKIYTLEEASNLIPFHPACRCTVIAHIEHYDIPEKILNDPNILFCAPLKRIGNNNYDSDVDPKEEFANISKKGYIEYHDNNGNKHKVNVNCTESSIVKFGDENEIKEKLNDEECYQYDILDNEGKKVVTIYKSKSHNRFSMEHLISIYDNLNKILKSECDEIVLSSQEFENSSSGGFVLPSNPHRIHIMGITNSRNLEPVLIHEMAHSFDVSNGYLSSSKRYKQFVPKSMLIGDEDTVRHNLAEDFAYSMEYLFKDGDVDLTDAKTKYLYGLLGIQLY